jgi:DNA primase
MLIEKVDDELKPFLAIPQIPLIITDSYFLHYSVAPILRNNNPDEVMNSALEFQKEYMTTNRYKALRSITVLDDEMSKIYSFALTKSVLEKLYEKLKDRLRQMNPEEQQEVQSMLQQMLQVVNQLQQQLTQLQPQPQNQQSPQPLPEKPPIEELPMAPGVGCPVGSTAPTSTSTPAGQQPQLSPQSQPSQSSQQHLQQLTKKLLEKLGVDSKDLKKCWTKRARKLKKRQRQRTMSEDLLEAKRQGSIQEQ